MRVILATLQPKGFCSLMLIVAGKVAMPISIREIAHLPMYLLCLPGDRLNLIACQVDKMSWHRPLLLHHAPTFANLQRISSDLSVDIQVTLNKIIL